MSKKETRSKFRRDVFKRSKHKCECCGVKGYDRQEAPLDECTPLDAHHITNRNHFKNGGYNIANGISVCDKCHVLAEMFHQTGEAHPGYSPEELYSIIGSSLGKSELLDARNQ